MEKRRNITTIMAVFMILNLQNSSIKCLTRNFSNLRIIQVSKRRLYGGKTNSDKPPKPITAPGWVTVRLGSEKRVKQVEMDERLYDAKRWVSQKLSDDEADLLNRELGIEAEVEEYKSPRAKSNPKQISFVDSKGSDRLKGFLELNPFICSGCGSSFQSKSPDSPGYLPKEKFQEHRENAELIREKQEAIKVLNMAGIDIDSPAAIEILSGANISPKIISGLQNFGSSNPRKRYSHKVSDSLEEDSEKYLDNLIDIELDEPEQLRHISTTREIGVETVGKEMDEMELNKAILKSLQNAVSGQKKSLIGSASLSVKKSESLKSRFKQKTLESDVDGEEYEEKSLINDIDGELQSAERTAAQRTFYKSLDERFGGEGESRAYLDQEAVNIDGDINSGKFSQPEKEGVCICQRCYRLQQYGQVEQSLRPGWSSHELLTPERFETLLGSIRDNQAVVLCLVDIFDLQGSLLKNLRTIAGKNPVVIAANKVDLLPKDVSLTRLNDWVYRAVKDHCSFLSPRELKEDSAADWSRYRGAGPGGNSKPPSRFETAEDVTNRIRQKRFSKALEQDEEGVLRKSNVHLVSCESGYGMTSLVDSLMAMAKDNGNRVYVMGAANVGKSSFINRMLSGGPSGRSTHKKKGGTNLTPLATVSNLPGTTLDFLKMRLPNGVTMFDTPGLIQRGQLTSRVTTAELKKIIPSKPINAVTIRLEEGKCVLIGGLARVELAKVSGSRRINLEMR